MRALPFRRSAHVVQTFGYVRRVLSPDPIGLFRQATAGSALFTRRLRQQLSFIRSRVDRPSLGRPSSSAFVRRYGIAIVVLAVAALIQKQLWPMLPPSPLLFFYPAALVVAWKAGLGPAVLSIALSLPLIAYWFLPPYNSFAIDRPDQTLDLAIFAVLATLVSIIIARLKRLEMMARAAIQVAPFPTVLLAADGRILHANPAFHEALKYLATDIQGKVIQEFLHPDHTETFRTAITRLEVEKEKESLNCSVVQKDGRIIQIEGTVASIRAAGRRCFLAQFVDVTARRAAEDGRERALFQVRSIIDECPVGMTILRDGGRVVEHNRAGLEILYGHNVPERTEDSASEIFLDREGAPLPLEQRPSVRALRGERISGLEIQVCRQDGVVAPLLINAAPVLSNEGDGPSAVVVFQDIFAIKEVERLRAQWNAVVAHDLRQPINAILLRTALLARGGIAPKNDVQALFRATRRLDGMIRDLLDASRLEVRQMSLVRRKVDLVDLVVERLGDARHEVPERRFEVSIDHKNTFAWADWDRLGQILDNLLSNAVKYGNASAPIGVSIGRKDGSAFVAVSNEGRAISQEELPLLFERFRRTDSAVRSRIKGTGLGLYIARELAVAHGGNVTCESEPGGKTTFRFTIPLVTEAGPGASPSCRGEDRRPALAGDAS